MFGIELAAEYEYKFSSTKVQQYEHIVANTDERMREVEYTLQYKEGRVRLG